MNRSRSDQGRIDVIDPLRGIAALSVAWLHIVHDTRLVPRESFISLTSTFGKLGVQVFFVISGFVIPYALAASGYRVREYGRFMLKRVIRLDPPYLLSMCVTLLLAAIYQAAFGTEFTYTLPQLLVHLGYLNVFFRYQWINPVFWTLGIEVQYYLLIGLAFPLLLRRNLFWLAVAPLCLVAAVWSSQQNYIFMQLPQQNFIFMHLPFFLMGVAAFHYRRDMMTELPFLIVVFLLGIFVATSGLTFQEVSPRLAGLAGVFVAMVIGTVNAKLRPLARLGTISYSLYLLHWPIAAFVSNIVRERVPALVGVFITLAVCIFAAWAMYRLVELPSLRWSRRIRYRSSKPASQEAPQLAKGPKG